MHINSGMESGMQVAVRPHGAGRGLASLSARARSRTSSSIAGVSLPVNVFCWLGWNVPSSGSPAPSSKSAPWPKRGRGRGTCAPRSCSAASQANCAEADDHPDVPAAARAPARPTAGMRRAPPGSGGSAAARSARRRRSTRRAAAGRRRARREIGWLAKPARCIAAIRKSPDRSPVNTRPVRLPPCAAGARPRTYTRAAGSPKPGVGAAPVGLRREGGAALARDALAPGDQARAAAALDDAGLQVGKGARRFRQ